MKHRSEFMIPTEHPALAGHFPGNPVVPGVVLLDEVLRLAKSVNEGVNVVGVDGVKFLHPLRPQQPFTVHLADKKNSRLRFECHCADICIAVGYLLLEGES